MKSPGLLAAFASITILGIAVGCSQPTASLSGDDDDQGNSTDDSNVTSKVPETKSSTTTTSPPAATTPPAPTTTADAGADTGTGTACQDLQTCCATIDNPIAKFACDAAGQAADEDTCAEVLQGCQLAKNLPSGNGN